MEYKRQINRRLIRKAINLLVFGLFTANAKAQILFGPPTIVVQPVGISVQKGDIGVIATTATSVSSLTFQWYLNGKKINPNNGNGSPISVVNVAVPLVGTVSTLTVKNISNDYAGTYNVVVQNSSGSVVSSNAAMIIVGNVVSNVVSAVTSATGMVAGGFKLQFSAPIGSNVVIQATSDMSNWSSISTNTCTTGAVTFTDTVAKVVSCRFYRAKIQ
jgi:hypothetical protein